MKIYFLLIVSSVLLTACISQEPQTVIEDNRSEILQETKVKDRGEPFSVGPDAPPSAVGPSSLPQAQAVTKDENIRLTLPLKTASE